MRTARSPAKTFVDYAAIAVCPVLIMLLVGSLIFFLLAIGYAGTHLGVLRWIFFWFVLAMVLVSRIAIERGSDYAGFYGFCLAAATAFMLVKYVAFSPLAWGLLALIWWATHKLTWDCTVIDDDQDASGEGLLQAANLEPNCSSRRKEPLESPEACGTEGDLELTSAPTPKGLSQTRSKTKPAKVHWWERAPRKATAASQPHAPGLWVIYVSLGALPLFGLGQGLIPQQDVATRQYAFCLLAIYLAAALGLLLLSSFLGLRRYLRQRFLRMPPAMAATWLTTGTLIGSALLLACLLMPRPSASWSLTAIINRLGDPATKQAQRQAASAKLPDDLPGREAKTQGNAPGPGDTSQSSAPAEGTNGPGRSGTTGQHTGQTEQAKAPRKTPGEGEPGTPQPSQPPPTPSVRSPLNLLRLAIYALLLALGLFLVLKNRVRLWQVLLQFWHDFQAFWQGLFARKAKTAAAVEIAKAASTHRPFAALTNPFASGAAAQMSLEDLIIRTFEGLEAWGAEHHCGRAPDQTPFEFAGQLGAQAPDLAPEAEQTTRLYAQVAYAHTATLPPCRTMLEILWSKMNQQPRLL